MSYMYITKSKSMPYHQVHKYMPYRRIIKSTYMSYLYHQI